MKPWSGVEAVVSLQLRHRHVMRTLKHTTVFVPAPHTRFPPSKSASLNELACASGLPILHTCRRAASLSCLLTPTGAERSFLFVLHASLATCAGPCQISITTIITIIILIIYQVSVVKKLLVRLPPPPPPPSAAAATAAATRCMHMLSCFLYSTACRAVLSGIVSCFVTMQSSSLSVEGVLVEAAT